jgi:hypothetical protein
MPSNDAEKSLKGKSAPQDLRKVRANFYMAEEVGSRLGV